MAGNTLDVVTSAWINVVTSIVILLAFAVLKNQPMNARVYFPKWFLELHKRSAGSAGGFDPASRTTNPIGRFLNLNVKSYAHVMDWIWTTLRMPEMELIEHAGLDSAVLLRVFLLGYNYCLLSKFVFKKEFAVRRSPQMPTLRLHTGASIGLLLWTGLSHENLSDVVTVVILASIA